MSRITLLSAAALLLAVLLPDAAGADEPPPTAPSTADRAAPRIIGGDDIVDGEYPFLVALVFAANPDNHDAQICGGTLVGPRYVLTAAHCVDFIAKPEDLAVLVGTRDLDTGGRRIVVSEFKIHEAYNPENADSDVAVLELSEDAEGIKPARLMTRSLERTHAGPKKPLVTMGWGNVNTAAPEFPTIARKVTVPVVARKVCNRSDYYNGQVTETMLCAGFHKGGKDSCQGDSGGPLIAPEPVGTRYVLAGVVSWGDGCAEPKKPGVYSRVSVLRPWVVKTIREMSAN